MRKFIALATETVFGAVWGRPGLDLKTRTLVCVVSDAATGREPELAIHVRMALRQGWTEDVRSEEHTSELQSRLHLVCRLLLEKKKKKKTNTTHVRTRKQHR